MLYLLIYFIIGFILVLLDFRQYLGVFFGIGKNKSINTPFGRIQAPVDISRVPEYARRGDYLVALIFIITWPIKFFYSPVLGGFIRNFRAGRIRMWPRK